MNYVLAENLNEVAEDLKRNTAYMVDNAIMNGELDPEEVDYIQSTMYHAYNSSFDWCGNVQDIKTVVRRLQAKNGVHSIR